ncbi:MAG: hypothetical protein RBG13Loki_0834 [Promethearchaeota archaeon CR_4]|nr:MAG: hypothetical protein RBG13Loki_0834 [Candidatus Lokiarchaeota archaeon CR_4]
MIPLSRLKEKGDFLIGLGDFIFYNRFRELYEVLKELMQSLSSITFLLSVSNGRVFFIEIDKGLPSL